MISQDMLSRDKLPDLEVTSYNRQRIQGLAVYIYLFLRSVGEKQQTGVCRSHMTSGTHVLGRFNPVRRTLGNNHACDCVNGYGCPDCCIIAEVKRQSPGNN